MSKTLKLNAAHERIALLEKQLSDAQRLLNLELIIKESTTNKLKITIIGEPGLTDPSIIKYKDIFHISIPRNKVMVLKLEGIEG